MQKGRQDVKKSRIILISIVVDTAIVAHFYYYVIKNVIIECAGLVFPADLPCIQRLKLWGLSVVLRTTTAIDPSGLMKAVVEIVSIEDELIMRLAPGRMNFEKCPM